MQLNPYMVTLLINTACMLHPPYFPGKYLWGTPFVQPNKAIEKFKGQWNFLVAEKN